MRLVASRSRLLNVSVAAMALGIATMTGHTLLGIGGRGSSSVFKDGVYTAVELLAVAVCGARAVRRRDDRAAWTLMTLGLMAWTAGDLVWTLWLNDLQNPPTPSVADALYLLMYPTVYGAVMLLIRSRLRQAGAAQWLDGAVVGLTIAAAGAELILPTLLRAGTGHFITDATNLAYPLGDLALLAFVVVAFSLAGWRPGRLWLWVGAGIAVSAIADLVYVVESASGTYVVGGILDTMWPLSMVLLALAAWQPSQRRPAAAVPAPHTILLTLLSAVGALAVLVVAAFQRVTGVTVAFAAAALLLAMLRGMLSYLENVRMLRSSARRAVTDNLTGLGNRRRLMEDLEEALRLAGDQHPYTLAFFDLNGFKRYNDTFGHGAGDALLARVGAALAAAVEGKGTAYRPGGDEFCVLLPGRIARHDRLIASASAALTERGSAFTVGASCGSATIPDDAATASAVLQLADQRMYADKNRSSRDGRARTRDVLMAVLSERTPGLHDHVHGVGELVRELGRDFSLDSEQLDELLRAAELHDIGKLAVPDEILGKRGPLNASEWEFIHQHPIIGERILNVDPALRPVGRLVRASHERWDGGGYPDGLAGAAIPLGARIIAACDAFEAMTSERCYQAARTREEAIAELERHAGSQFDTAVVQALARRLRAHPELLARDEGPNSNRQLASTAP